jgi:hypothetical protein
MFVIMMKVITSIINKPSVNTALTNVINVSDMEACLIQGAPVNRKPVIIDETHCSCCLVVECAVDLSFSYTEVTHEGGRLGGAVLTDLYVNNIVDYNNTVAPYTGQVHPLFEGFDVKNFQCNVCYNDMYFNVGDLIQKFKFKHKMVCAFNCSICSYLNISSISNIHKLVGFSALDDLVMLAPDDPPSLPPLQHNINHYLNVVSRFSGLTNYMARVGPVTSHLNIGLLSALARGHSDPQIVELLQFGFPLDLDKSKFIPSSKIINHSSSLSFPSEVNNYLSEEIKFGSILGPFSDPPYPDLHCSPLMTAPKDSCKCRVIVDLSFPSVHQHAVNMSVSNSNYLGTPFSLKLPTIDTLSQALTIVGNNVKNFEVDLARAFGQLNLDPFDVKYMGLYWRTILRRYRSSVWISPRDPLHAENHRPNKAYPFYTLWHFNFQLYQRHYRHSPR